MAHIEIFNVDTKYDVSISSPFKLKAVYEKQLKY